MGLPREQALTIYANEGAAAAAEAAKVSIRTVQRWASDAGVRSGYKRTTTRGHGTAACYLRGCRKKECVEANREENRQVKARRVARFKAGKVHIKHGVSGYSNWDCRCPLCTNAWSAYLRERRAGKVEPCSPTNAPSSPDS